MTEADPVKLSAWSPPTAEQVLGWTDEEFARNAEDIGYDFSMSVTNCILRMADDQWYGPTDAARLGFVQDTEAFRLMVKRLSGYKGRSGFNEDKNNEPYIHRGSWLGLLWKSFIYDSRHGKKDGRALIRYALAPRLEKILMRLTRTAPKKRETAVPLTAPGNNKSIIGQLDFIDPHELVALVRYFEGKGHGPRPILALEIEKLTEGDLWEVIV